MQQLALDWLGMRSSCLPVPSIASLQLRLAYACPAPCSDESCVNPELVSGVPSPPMPPTCVSATLHELRPPATTCIGGLLSGCCTASHSQCGRLKASTFLCCPLLLCSGLLPRHQALPHHPPLPPHHPPRRLPRSPWYLRRPRPPQRLPLLLRSRSFLSQRPPPAPSPLRSHRLPRRLPPRRRPPPSPPPPPALQLPALPTCCWLCWPWSAQRLPCSEHSTAAQHSPVLCCGTRWGCGKLSVSVRFFNQDLLSF